MLRRSRLSFAAWLAGTLIALSGMMCFTELARQS
jgi:hypothetical protein